MIFNILKELNSKILTGVRGMGEEIG